jgi:hypothetical protein
MPLPKSLTDKIKALLKDGAELPAELESGVFFESDDAFAATVAKKTGSKVSEAERKAAQAAKEARDAALAEIFEKVGVKDADQLEEFKAKIAAAEGTLTEVEKVKGDHKKALKEIEKLTTQVTELTGFKTTSIKRQALDPHLNRIHSDARDMVTELVLGKLVIDDKGNVTAPEGKAIDAYLDDLVKAKPILKAPDYKAGAGTGAGEPKPKGGEGANGNGNGSNGKPDYKTVAEALRTEAMAIAAKSAAGAAGP